MEEEIEKNIVRHLDSDNSKVDDKGVSKDSTNEKQSPSIEDFVVTEESLNSDPPKKSDNTDFDENNIFSYKYTFVFAGRPKSVNTIS